MNLTTKDVVRFLSKVDRSDGQEGCWLWRAFVDDSTGGYGRFKIGGKRGRMFGAHRVAYVIANGPIPKTADSRHGTCVMHTCDTPACVNPGHLVIGTQRENIDDRTRKGRGRGPAGAATGPRARYAPKGIRGTTSNPWAYQFRLTEDKVREIRSRVSVGERAVEVAASVGVSVSMVYLVKSRKCWAWVA